MREIKFRGKQLNDMSETSNMYASKKGTWRYGTYKYIHKYYDGVNAHMICDIYGREIMCDKETIGQYTGLKDKNGKEIYEGDVVKLILSETHKYEGDIYFKDCSFRLRGDSPYIYFHELNQDKIEVIGNIHDKEEV